jgi:hypothetical protein
MVRVIWQNALYRISNLIDPRPLGHLSASERKRLLNTDGAASETNDALSAPSNCARRLAKLMLPDLSASQLRKLARRGGRCP